MCGGVCTMQPRLLMHQEPGLLCGWTHHTSWESPSWLAEGRNNCGWPRDFRAGGESHLWWSCTRNFWGIQENQSRQDRLHSSSTASQPQEGLRRSMLFEVLGNRDGWAQRNSAWLLATSMAYMRYHHEGVQFGSGDNWSAGGLGRQLGGAIRSEKASLQRYGRRRRW